MVNYREISRPLNNDRLAMPSQGGVNSLSKTIVMVSEEGVDSSI
jgi:hypothetical protein